MYEDSLAQAKRRMVTSAQTGELAIHPFSGKALTEAEPGARAPRREEGAQVVCCCPRRARDW